MKAPPNHPVLSGGSFGMMSAEKPMFPTHTEPTHENLVRILNQMGLKHEQTHGRYNEPERSVIIHNPREDQMKTLGKLFGQESVIHSSKGQHKLIYTNGPDENKFRGTVPGEQPHQWFEHPPDDYYTHLPGNGHFRINFDFKQAPQGQNSNIKLGKSVKKDLMETVKDEMPGGKGDNKPDSDFDSKALALGVKVEMEEHGLDATRAKEIAKDHLTENPKYYNTEKSEGQTPVIFNKYIHGVEQVSTKKTFTPEEAAQVAVEYTRLRVNQLAKSLQELRERELKKAIIPPHKHNSGTTTSSGIEDVPPSKTNPPGKDDMLKEETSEGSKEESSSESSPKEETSEGSKEESSMSKEELCKECGKSHDMKKGCSPKPSMDMDKAILKDAKGKTIDNGIHPESVLPGDKKSKVINASDKPGVIKKSLAQIHNQAKTGIFIEKSVARMQTLAKAFAPPMAKPPSGVNMGTHVPVSKPPKAGSMAKVVLPPTPAPQQGIPQAIVTKKDLDTKKKDLDKGVMADIARRNSPPVPEPTKDPEVKLPSQQEQAERASMYAEHMPTPTSTGHQKPGIFGRLNRLGKSELTKAATQPLPVLKPAASGLHTVGGTTTPSTASMGPEATGTGLLPTSIKTAVKPAAKPALKPLPVHTGSPVLVKRPALKPGATGLFSATGSDLSGTDPEKTVSMVNDKTAAASPKSLIPGKSKPKV